VNDAFIVDQEAPAGLRVSVSESWWTLSTVSLRVAFEFALLVQVNYFGKQDWFKGRSR